MRVKRYSCPLHAEKDALARATCKVVDDVCLRHTPNNPTCEVNRLPGPGPHSRACGVALHDHGEFCANDCPTCGSKPRMPRIGDVVHYVSYGTPGGEYPSVCRAAVVAERVDSGELSVVVLNPKGVYFNLCRHTPFRLGRDERVGGTWHHVCGA